MKQIDYNFYMGLRRKSTSLNGTPKTVKQSSIFKNLFEAGILSTEKSGRGTRIVIQKIDDFDKFLSTYFPSQEDLKATKANNIKQFKNSKARKTNELPMFFLRGFKDVTVNSNLIDLNHYTESNGFFGLTNLQLVSDKICFVENKNTFLNAEKLLGKEWLFIHSYGRVGKNALRGIQAKTVLVFVDFDFNGLDEYLRIKSHLAEAKLYIPNNFNELFDKYAASMNGKQKASKKVAESQIDEVIKIRNLVETTNKFLEQEVLIND